MLALIFLLFWAQAIDVNAVDQLFNKGRYQEAATQYQALLRRFPEDPALLLRVGFCEFSLEEFKNAEATFRKVLKLRSGLPQAEVGLGSVLIALDRSREAIPLLEDGVKKMPGDPQARRALGRAYVAVGEFIKGEDTLRKLVKEYPKDWESWYLLGRLLVDRNYSLPAYKALETSLALYPDNPVALIYRAGALTQLGRIKQAEAEFAALAGNPKVSQSPEYHLGYAQLLFTKGEYARALDQAETALKQDPDSGKIRYWKARILYYLGKEDLALEEAKKCVELSPDMPGGRNLLLRIYRRKGMQKEAAEQAEWLRKHEHKIAMGRGR